MELTTRNPYWLLKNGYCHSYPSLQENIQTDIVVMGGGITGALVTYRLVNAGWKVVVIDKRNIGMGSTSASTALLQYEIDTPLGELMEKVGEKRATDSYLACYRSIDELEEMIRTENFRVGFKKRCSLQYASFEKDAVKLEKEAELRNKIGISVELFERAEIEEKFKLKAPKPIFSKQAAQFDPYLLTHAIFQKGDENLRVFDRTKVADIQPGKSRIVLKTDTGKKITARYLVVAAGYESQHYIPYRVVDLLTTYAIISEPMSVSDVWYKNALIWETKTPYLYMRTTSDFRVIVGGRDDERNDSRKRKKRLPRKAVKLAEDFHKLMPHLSFHTDFAWAGTFGSTTDSLPYVGSIRQMPRTFFALGFGGNGITFSVLAADILCTILKGKEHPLQVTFAFDR